MVIYDPYNSESLILRYMKCLIFVVWSLKSCVDCQKYFENLRQHFTCSFALHLEVLPGNQNINKFLFFISPDTDK
jgi:hypothetical protein